MPEQNSNVVQVENRGDVWSWTIVKQIGDEQIVLATSTEHDDKKSCLASLFTLYFGAYDESFMDVYNDWQELTVGDPVPLSYLTIKRRADAPDPQKHMEDLLANTKVSVDGVDQGPGTLGQTADAFTGLKGNHPLADPDGPNYSVDDPE